MMNNWGEHKIPFLFIIDYEMNAIQLFRLDHSLPPHIAFSFHESPDSGSVNNPPILDKYPIPFSEYEKAFDEVQNEILAGNSFLLNLTFPTLIKTNLSLREIYSYCRAPYKILVDGQFVCFSPESFISIKNGRITTFPMKGTINAHIPDAEMVLLGSRKEYAEHCTVVDLLRNDLSMVAVDIQVDKFRYIDKVVSNAGSILQVSSSISGALENNYSQRIGDILFALLPAGSITGAPKRKTISIISQIEKSLRGYYTGICGVFDGCNVDSAVMIRFIELNQGKMYYRSGGGITFLSEADSEYNELIDKIYVPVA